MIEHRFELNEATKQKLLAKKPKFGFGGFGEIVYYRTYSRLKPDGTNEHWPDTVIRVINGLFSIRKDYYLKNDIHWDDVQNQAYASHLAHQMFEMKWLPPGRGLWACGTEYVYERGAMALQNCGFVSTENDLARAAEWATDALMCGVGVGFDVRWRGRAEKPNKLWQHFIPGFVIPDSREGWAASVGYLIRTYTEGAPFRVFDYSNIRPEGAPINGFGGTCSGADPLIKLHKRLEGYLDRFCDGHIGHTELVANIMNAIGCCVVAGNVRRSAEIAIGPPSEEFIDLKNYDKKPDRMDIGWMSNNACAMYTYEDFSYLPKIAEGIKRNSEPGAINMVNVQRYGRMGDARVDNAKGFNPCGEQPLESYEVCCLSEVFPTKCRDKSDFIDAVKCATFYASTVALLETHREETNEVIRRNRRIGVSLSGVAEWTEDIGTAKATRWMKDGYKVVRALNTQLAIEAGVPLSIRVTTIKPSGSISQLVGCSPGMHWPIFKYAVRRIRIAQGSKIAETLTKSGIPYEEDKYSDNTLVFEFPIAEKSYRVMRDVSAWAQFARAAMLQREWSDNSVSVTIYFQEHESHQIEDMLSSFIPVMKTVSMKPYVEGHYVQAPYEEISEEEYESRLLGVSTIDWDKFCGTDGKDQRFCDTDSCEV